MKKKTGSIVMVLFGFPFAAVGIFATYMVFASISEWEASKNWSKAKCKIERIDLKSSRSSKGSTTYCVEGSFSYYFDDVKYTSNQITFWSTKDNVDGFP